MAGPLFGSLFGGLAQGAEAGMRLNLQQQGVNLQQENQQRLLELAQTQESRMKFLQDRQALVDQLGAVKQAGEMPPGPAKDAYLAAMLGPNGLGFSEEMAKTIRRQSEEETGLYDSLMTTFLQRYPQMGAEGAKALFSRMGPKELGQLMVQEVRRQRFEDMVNATGAVATGLRQPDDEAAIAPQVPPQGAPLAPEAALGNLRLARDRLTSILSQTSDAGEREQVQQLLKGIDERMTAIKEGPGGMQRAATLQFTDMIARAQKGDPQALAWLNYYKQYQVAPGGALAGAGTAGAMSPVLTPTPGPAQATPFGISRPITQAPAEVATLADDRALIDALKDLQGRAQQLPDTAFGRLSLSVRGQVEKRTPIAALNTSEREYLSRFQALRILYDRALSNGSSIFRSYNLVNMMQAVMGEPTSAGAADRIGAVLGLAEKKHAEFQKAMEQSGRTPMLGGPAARTPQQEANEFLRGR